MITIGIRKYLVKQPRTKRFKKAAGYIRNRVAHYTKLDEENVKISKELNNRIMKHYSKKMVPVKLSVKLDGGKAMVSEFVEQPKKQEQKKVEAEPKKKQDKPAKAKSGAATKQGSPAKAKDKGSVSG